MGKNRSITRRGRLIEEKKYEKNKDKNASICHSNVVITMHLPCPMYSLSFGESLRHLFCLFYYTGSMKLA